MSVVGPTANKAHDLELARHRNWPGSFHRFFVGGRGRGEGGGAFVCVNNLFSFFFFLGGGGGGGGGCKLALLTCVTVAL